MHRPARPFWTVLAAICALAFGTTPPPVRAEATAAPPDAQTILDRARSTVAARRLPAFIAYTQYAAFMRHGKVQAERSRIILRMADGKANITRIPDSATDRVDTRPAVKDRPLVYPTTSFGLVKRRSGEQPSTFETRSTPVPAPASVPVIGRVSSVSRDYDATLIGTEQLNDTTVYHLNLTPRFDPRHHPIREMFVDTTTFDPRRMAIEVSAQAGPASSRPTVNIDFAAIDGVWLITHASMDFVLRLAFLSYGGSAEFRASDITFPASEPAWMFDSALLAAHLKEAHAASGPVDTPR